MYLGTEMWVLGYQTPNHTDYITFEGPLHFKMVSDKVQLSYRHLEKDSSGICFIWSHTCLQLKQIRYPSFQHSKKGLDFDSLEVHENLS